MIKEEALGYAVIKQAFVDACSKNDNYDRICARNFLCGINRVWRRSLEDWCWVAGIEPEALLPKMRSIWGNNGKEEHIPSQELLQWIRTHLMREEEWYNSLERSDECQSS